MDSIDLVRDNLVVSEEIVLSRIEEMREHCFVFPTAIGGCHTLWILGHLAYIEGLVIDSFMRGEPHPLADWEAMFDGEEITARSEDYVSFDEALSACRERRHATLSHLESLTERDLDQQSARAPKSAEQLFGTYRKCFQYVANHWFMHRGQLANARRAAGLERMWY